MFNKKRINETSNKYLNKESIEKMKISEMGGKSGCSKKDGSFYGTFDSTFENINSENINSGIEKLNINTNISNTINQPGHTNISKSSDINKSNEINKSSGAEKININSDDCNFDASTNFDAFFSGTDDIYNKMNDTTYNLNATDDKDPDSCVGDKYAHFKNALNLSNLTRIFSRSSSAPPFMLFSHEVEDISSLHHRHFTCINCTDSSFGFNASFCIDTHCCSRVSSYINKAHCCTKGDGCSNDNLPSHACSNNTHHCLTKGDSYINDCVARGCSNNTHHCLTKGDGCSNNLPSRSYTNNLHERACSNNLPSHACSNDHASHACSNNTNHYYCYDSTNTLCERIDHDYPSTKSSKFTGKSSRSSTPIGKPILSKINTTDMTECIDNAKMSCDQEGSRHIQKRLEKSSSKEVYAFYQSIKNNLKELSLDLFGNYVIQKMIDLMEGSTDDLIMHIKKDVKELSMHMYGCRVVQKIIDIGRGEAFVDIFIDNLVEMIEDQNGNHVIQKYVESQRQNNSGGTHNDNSSHNGNGRHNGGSNRHNDNNRNDAFNNKSNGSNMNSNCNKEKCEGESHNKMYSIKKTKEQSILSIKGKDDLVVNKNSTNQRSGLDFILDLYTNDTVRLSKHRYGCRVIQRLFENSNKIEGIVDKLCKNIEILIEDQYGNYVLQHVIENKDKHRKKIVEAILGQKKVLEWSMHKFASNVIEKCVFFEDRFLEVFFSDSHNLTERKKSGNFNAGLQTSGKKMPGIVLLAMDRFGNYVVQKILEKKGVKEVLREFAGDLRRSVYAKHILSKIV